MSESGLSNNRKVVAIPWPIVKKKVECAGAPFLRYYSIKCHGDDALLSTSKANEKAEEVIFDDDVEYLRSLDPKDWKMQDHYAVLGMKNLRYKATDDDIKRAYRQKVLKHHPDKRKAQGEEVRSDDDYFTCITKAYETLGTPSKRRSYDSVDHTIDDSIPTPAEIKKDGFYKAFANCFESNARWSEKRNVPFLGDENSSREHVERFYAFWYEFESWREFSYLDEEEKEKGADREERRWIEKQNKAARAKLKKEEMARIRSLVDLAYAHDPRLQRFKQEDKDKKLAAKRARQDAVQAKKAEEERLIKEAQLAKQKAEEAEKARLEAARAEREQQKKNLGRESRKALRDLCKSNNYYAESEDETVANMAAVEKICELLKVNELQDFMKDLESNGKEAFLRIVKETEDKLEAERKAMFETKKAEEQKAKKDSAVKAPIEWTVELTQLLIKAVNLFPAGTNQRWEVVANFLNQHGVFTDEKRFTAKDVLNKAKDLQSSDFSKSNLKKAANEEAFDMFEKERKRSLHVDDSGISKSDPVKLVNGVSNSKAADDNKPEDRAWTKTEQELLEQAIKTFPVNTPERWEKIADCLPNPHQKDCMKRYKELVELVKAKKQAANLAK
ncbi:LOW QUALITY PROTEIN: dnaJ homolog subfamily C member 2-like [Manduca sexta]|uniref:LOW QUALITY PROTEIN: dnaJ homolog subfamily C member 2-like n=1 Tax=Manduca sexta TaxID=7130 RepID=UPI00188E9304|nr:LOW QUALITY PROTEIN: dnaJ homolog subfamily C member 2-like [Manduca sexta]